MYETCSEAGPGQPLKQVQAKIRNRYRSRLETNTAPRPEQMHQTSKSQRQRQTQAGQPTNGAGTPQDLTRASRLRLRLASLEQAAA